MKKLITLVTLCTMLCFANSTTATAQAVTLDREYRLGGEPQPHPQTIYVKARLNGQTVLMPILVFFSDPVLWVKQEVALYLQIPIDSFELTFNGRPLDEDKPLNYYGITSKSVLGIQYL